MTLVIVVVFFFVDEFLAIYIYIYILADIQYRDPNKPVSTHRIHGSDIFTYIYHEHEPFIIHVGKYTSPMDPMGYNGMSAKGFVDVAQLS